MPSVPAEMTPPAGMTIMDNVVRWTPGPDQVRDWTIRVKASDGKYHITPSDPNQEYRHTQTFTLTVLPEAPDNRAPVIVSTPPRTVASDALYAYDVLAADPDDDPVSYDLVAPTADGVVLDRTTGALRWLPAAWQAGEQTISVRALDRFGASVVHTFSVLVRGVNRPPLITSSPPPLGEVGEPFFYPIRVEDPDGETVTLSWLGTLPPGLQLVNGVIQGTPTAPGTYNSTLHAQDARGAVTQQPLRLEILDVQNHRPRIHSTPVLTTATGATYSYQVSATDLDVGQTLTYTVTTVPPPPAVEMMVSGTGLVSWAVPGGYVAPGATAPVQVTVRVTDNGMPQRFIEQQYTLVVRGNRAPTLAAITNPTVTAGNPFRLDLQGADLDGDPLTYTLTGRLGTLVPAGL
jgi:hypothetical protein